MEKISNFFKNTRVSSLILIAFFIVFAVIRLTGLSRYSLWQDELALDFHAYEPLDYIINYSLNYGKHPPLFYMMSKMWAQILSFGEWQLRLPHAMVGLLLCFLPLLYRKEIGEKNSKIWFLLLLTNNILIQWSKEAVIYSLATFFVSWSLLQTLRYIKFGGFLNWVLLVLILITTFYLNYLAAFMVLFIGISFGIVKSSEFNFKVKSAYAYMVSSLLFLPWAINTSLFQQVFFPNIKDPTSSEASYFWNKPVNDFSQAIYLITDYFSNSYIFELLVLISIYWAIAKGKVLKNSLFKVMGLSLSQFFLFVGFLYMNNYSLLVIKYFVMTIPLYLGVISICIGHMPQKLFLKFIAFWLLIACFNVNKKINAQGYQNIRGGLEYINELSGHKNVYFITGSIGWMYNYIRKYEIHKRMNVKQLYRYFNKRNSLEALDNLKRGDVIFYLDSTCDEDFLLASLAKKKINFELIKKLDGVGVIGIYGQ